nr:hypothetical protein [Tanacetum cinerariifolium]
MTTPTVTSSTDSQMHNNIMAAGSRDHPPMLATGRYPQWRSRFLRYIDTRPNGDALRKCILGGPYKPTTVLVQAVAATDDSPAIPEHTTEMWEAIERLQQCESLNIQDVKTNLFWEFGKEIAKPITPPTEIASKEDSDLEQAQRDKDMQKNLALIAKYVKKIYKPTNNNHRTSSNSRNKNVDTTPRQPKRVKDFAYHKEKMLLCKQAEQGVPLQAEQYIEEVPTADTCTDSEPLEHVQNDTGYNVFANDLQHSEQSKSNDQNDVESDDERIALANLIANLKLDTCLMPLAIKTQNDTFIFVHELKQEMHADLKYVESLEKEIDKLESDKAEFSNMYDMILQECVSNDVTCSYLLSLSDLD